MRCDLGLRLPVGWWRRGGKWPSSGSTSKGFGREDQGGEERGVVAAEKKNGIL